MNRWEQGQLIFYALDPLQGQGKEVIRTKLGHASDLEWIISPDGSHIAIRSWSQLRGQVRILDLRNGTERNLQLPQTWNIEGHCWAADGNALFASVSSMGAASIARIDLDGKTHILLKGKNGLVGDPRMSPDGRHLAYFQQTYENNVWLLENF
jgi:dipeptidyl aminopeptidase/acylaminoacyl peptidase